MSRQDLIARLVVLQNEWPGQDILTITGFLDDAAVAKHVAFYEQRIAERQRVAS